MIFVAVGTQKFPLDRLLQAIDSLIEQNIIQEPVFAQTGYCCYKPMNFEAKPFLTGEEFAEKISACDLLITHSGVGTIIKGMNLGKPVIVFPRRVEYGEHVDDHQLQIAEAFSSKNHVLQADDSASLAAAIQEAPGHVFAPYQSSRAKFVKTIETYLDSI